MTIQTNGKANRQIYEFKVLDYTNNSLTINEWLTPLDTALNIKATYLVFEQTNNGATAEDIELELILDGVVRTVSQTADSGVRYWIIINHFNVISTVLFGQQLMTSDFDQSASISSKSVKIRVRQTSTVDVTSASIEVNMLYHKLELQE